MRCFKVRSVTMRTFFSAITEQVHQRFPLDNCAHHRHRAARSRHRIRLLLMSMTKRKCTSPFSMRFMASLT
jgi:hypothetical protein